MEMTVTFTRTGSMQDTQPATGTNRAVQEENQTKPDHGFDYRLPTAAELKKNKKQNPDAYLVSSACP